MAGVQLPTVKEILGRRDIQTTLKYAHLSPWHIQAVVEKGSLAHLELGTGSVLESVQGKEIQTIDSIA